MRAPLLSTPLPWLIGCALALAPLAAQSPCTWAYAPGDALAGTDGVVGSLTPWDPDGPGPLGELLVVAGEFRVAGSAATFGLAAYDPITRQWSSIGTGLPRVRSVAARPNGNLIAYSDSAGLFEWDGSTWTLIGSNFNGSVAALAVRPNGDVVAGGSFTTINGASIHGIASWNGTVWSPMGAPTVPWMLGRIDRFATLPNGDLVAVGLFTQIGGVACSLIARWDGTAWSPFGAGSTTSPVTMTVTDTGEVIAAGTFATATGTASFARWNGSAWVDIGVGLPMTAGLLAPLPGGEVLVFGAAGTWRSNAGTWSQLSAWGSTAYCAHAYAGNYIVAGGSFAGSAASPGQNLARWDGTAWRVVCDGNVGVMRTATALPDGSWFCGGLMTTLGGQPANRLGRFDGTAWTPIPSSAINAVKYAVARPNGEVVLVGEFPNAQGGMDFVMRWTPGGGVVPILQGGWAARIVRCMALAANGDVLMGYLDLATVSTGIARWNGSTVTFTPIAGVFAINAMLELPNGELLLAGSLSGSLHSLFRWNGGALQPFATALSNLALAVGLAPNGDVVAGGAFTSPMRIARWDGAAWQPYGPGLTDSVTSLVVLPDGDVVACERRNTSAGTTSQVRHWDGTGWIARGQTTGEANVAWSPTGELALYGDFMQIGGAANAGFARLRPTCAAAVVDRGGGCVGAGGPLVLTVPDRAWLGASLRTRVVGLPAGAFAIGVFGIAPQAVPLVQLHPLGVPGCQLLTTGDILLQFPVVGGAATPAFAVPSAAVLIGAPFEHQVLGVEVDAQGHAVAVTSSNAVHCTIGVL